jgi:tetratricopeptide (TPR) repeat protein
MRKRVAWASILLTACGGSSEGGPAVGSLEAGIRDFEAGNFEQARIFFERVLEARPEEPQAHYWLGCALGREAQHANKLHQAVLAPRIREHFERAVELDGDYLDARKRLVDFYTQAPAFMGGGFDKARAQVAEIERIDASEGRIARDRVEAAAAKE